MTNYRLIMTLLIKQVPYREIQSRLRTSPSTIAKARAMLDTHDITSLADLNSWSDEDLAGLTQDGRLLVPDQFLPLDLDQVINARIGRYKTPLRVLWAAYMQIPNPEGLRRYSYERFRQLVAAETASRGLTTRIIHRPGHTMQVDWAGKPLYVANPVTGQKKKVSVFVASLPYSGMVFAHAFPDQRQSSWLTGHRLAFEYFGGVVDVIVPDNASTASNKLSRTERARQVNTRYEEFLEYYNAAALPTNPAKPKEKGNVESAVKVITNWVILKNQQRVFPDIEDVNTMIAEVIDEINDRCPFRNRNTSRREIFDTAEASELGTLPTVAWEEVEWTKVKVAPDWHITISTVKYSVPYQLAGQVVNVRIRGQMLDVFSDGQKVATHQVRAQRGAYSTDMAHCPPEMEHPNALWTPGYFQAQARKIGPYTQELITTLIAAKKIPAQGFQPARNIVKLGSTTENKLVLEEACRRVLDQHQQHGSTVSFTAVKNMMVVVRQDQRTRPGARPVPNPSDGASSPVMAPGPRSGMLGGVEQFRLDALGKEV